MKEYLINKYGKYFFQDVYRYSKKLDSSNKGLKLPNIKHNLKTEFILSSLLDSTLKSTIEIFGLNYPFVAFNINKKGETFNVYIGSSGISGLQNNLKVPDLINKNLQINLNKLIWNYPTFKGKFEQKEVAYLYETKELIFMPFYE